MLGQFTASAYGKVNQLKTRFDAHETKTDPHSATHISTPGLLMLRDLSGRCRVVAPASTSDNTDNIVTSAWVTSKISTLGGGTVLSISQGTGLSFSANPLTSTGTIALANTAVTPGTYNFASITVDAQGRITSASNGSPIVGVTGSYPFSVTGGTTRNIGLPAASSVVDGYMTAVYATKIDGIASGAQVNTVSSVFGRTGAVVAVTNDYNIQKIQGVTVSASAPSGGTDGDIWFQYV